MPSRALSFLVVLLVVGCNWADGLRRAASVEHGCPQENIHVIADVTLALRGVVDPAIAECVSASIGAIEVPAGAAPGHLIHPVTR